MDAPALHSPYRLWVVRMDVPALHSRAARYTGFYTSTGSHKCYDMDLVIFRIPRYANRPMQFN